MVGRTDAVTAARGRQFVVGFGGLYVALGAGLAVAEFAEGRPVSNVLLVALFVTVPGVVLIYGGYRLPSTGVDRDLYPTIAAWCLAGFALMFASLALYQLEPAESISDPVRGYLVLTAFGSAAGFGVGSRDALAKTHARGVERRNEELERIRDELEDTVERLEATNDELEESNRRLEQFAFVISHDLQEPLRTIINYLDLLADRYGDRLDEEGEEFVESAIGGADRMGEMVDGLLALSRIETEGGSFRPVDLAEVARDARRDLEIQIRESDATVEVGELPVVGGDGDQLRQLFQNLIRNAVEYSGDEPPRVAISARRDGGPMVTISVRDEGIGIDPDDTDRIFEIFQRLHTRDERAGTGIGLAICRRIVDRHGGDIWVDSTPGEGTTFSFTLPAADEAST